jgi:hypothetical protein
LLCSSYHRDNAFIYHLNNLTTLTLCVFSSSEKLTKSEHFSSILFSGVICKKWWDVKKCDEKCAEEERKFGRTRATCFFINLSCLKNSYKSCTSFYSKSSLKHTH